MPFDDLSLTDLTEFAKSRGGACLSTAFSGPNEPHRWRCGRNHEFQASPMLLIHGGYWCDVCLPSVSDQSGWDYDEIVLTDPLLRQFHRA